MSFPKIRDRVFLGIVVGIIANVPKVAIDEISSKLNISQRSFRETAAGVWVSKRKEATSGKGHLLGNMLDFGMAMFGGLLLVNLFSQTGRDHIISKGFMFGIGFGSIITGLLSGMPTNKVRPKDAASNLSYIVSHAAYGIMASFLTTFLGHPSLFDVEPKNDYLEPTNPISEERGIG